MDQNRAIAAMLGKKLWTTDSFVPHYRPLTKGEWRILPGGQFLSDWGYFSKPCAIEMLPSLARRVKTGDSSQLERWETWMALTPHEIESQELGFRYAYQHVVIMGLGMGWIAANAALNPRVTNVTVVELDSDVIELFHDSGAYDSLPEAAQQKIRLVNADALTWQPGASDTVHFLHADIWLHLAEPATLGQVRQMQSNIRAEKVYYWGQEIAIYCAVKKFFGGNSPLTEDSVKCAIDEVIRLPLLLPHERDYPNMIEQVIQNRIERRLKIDVNLD